MFNTLNITRYPSCLDPYNTSSIKKEQVHNKTIQSLALFSPEADDGGACLSDAYTQLTSVFWRKWGKKATLAPDSGNI